MSEIEVISLKAPISVTAKVTNKSPYKLKLIQDSIRLDQGEWTTLPPQVINRSNDNTPGKAIWRSDSNSLLGGVAGRCTYVFVDSKGEIYSIYITWSNPLIGSSSYSISTDYLGDDLHLSYTADGGNNPIVEYMIVS
uniref:Insecticidal crystal-related protein n=1 Tax=Photorhabdus luminescens TaxID=29488 RepID=A6XB73_PHOLU|nr:insecticidal crystal-related protein [Photorhabdus luminescens]